MTDTDNPNNTESEQIERGLTKARDRFLKKYRPRDNTSVERPLRNAPEPDMGPDLGDEDGDYFSEDPDFTG